MSYQDTVRHKDIAIERVDGSRPPLIDHSILQYCDLKVASFRESHSYRGLGTGNLPRAQADTLKFLRIRHDKERSITSAERAANPLLPHPCGNSPMAVQVSTVGVDMRELCWPESRVVRRHQLIWTPDGTPS